MKNPTFTIQLVEFNYHFTKIEVFKQGVGRTLFCGDAYWQWGMGSLDFGTAHIRAHETRINWAEWLHNGLEGWHSCILHAEGGPFCIHDKHPDYEFVSMIWDLAQLTDKEVLMYHKDKLRLRDIFDVQD